MRGVVLLCLFGQHREDVFAGPLSVDGVRTGACWRVSGDRVDLGTTDKNVDRSVGTDLPHGTVYYDGVIH